jgi:restriction system protein
MSQSPGQSDHLLPPHGGYRKLRSFQVAEPAYDGTLIFCGRFVEKRSRTHDQMVQAARSGKQNIAEGSVASGTSKKSELKLTNVARASLEELMRDYHDFLRERKLPVWPKDSPKAIAVRSRYKSEGSDASDKSDVLAHIRAASPENAANTLLCLISQASYLLRRQLNRLEQDFLKHGGFTERLYAARTRTRIGEFDRSKRSESSDPVPYCPRCGKLMRRRTARTGSNIGQLFWGCTGYPDCKGTRPFKTSSDLSDQSDRSDT